MPNKKSDPTTVELLVETIKNSIQHGTFQPGDKLPTLKQMEEIYDVSRVTIREAIKVLEGKGFLYSQQGSGIYILKAEENSEPKEISTNVYNSMEIVSLFEFIFHYAVFQLKDREDLSEIVEWQKFNRAALENYQNLTFPQKLSYESMFGARLIQTLNSHLASDLFLKILKPANYGDHLVAKREDYDEVLKIDQKFIEALLDRDPYRACFWGHERTLFSLNTISRSANAEDYLRDRKNAVSQRSAAAFLPSRVEDTKIQNS